MVTHSQTKKLLARWVTLRLLRAAHGITWRCSGIVCTCSFHSRSAALISSSRFFGSASELLCAAIASNLSFLESP